MGSFNFLFGLRSCQVAGNMCQFRHLLVLSAPNIHACFAAFCTNRHLFCAMAGNLCQFWHLLVLSTPNMHACHMFCGFSHKPAFILCSGRKSMPILAPFGAFCTKHAWLSYLLWHSAPNMHSCHTFCGILYQPAFIWCN